MMNSIETEGKAYYSTLSPAFFRKQLTAMSSSFLHVYTEFHISTFSDLLNMNSGKLQEMAKDRKAWHAAVPGVAKSPT